MRRVADHLQVIARTDPESLRGEIVDRDIVPRSAADQQRPSRTRPFD